MSGGNGWTPSRSSLQNIEAAVEFALRLLARYLRSILKQDRTIGCDDTGVLLITPKAIPDLSEHPRGVRIDEVLETAIKSGQPSIKANMWGYFASRLPVVGIYTSRLAIGASRLDPAISPGRTTPSGRTQTNPPRPPPRQHVNPPSLTGAGVPLQFNGKQLAAIECDELL